MNTMTADLIRNATLLITLILLYELLSRKKITYSYLSQIASGLLFGGITIIGMNMPITYTPGVFYDGRTIVLSLTGFFTGGITTGVSVFLAGLYRIYAGGSGVWAGVASIVSAALIGCVFRYWFRKKPESVDEFGLISLGVSVHLAMLLCQLLLPWPSGLETIKSIWVSIILIFPLATMITGIFMRNGLRRIKAEADIRRSEVLYRTTLHSIGDAVMTTDQKGNINFLNPVAEQLSGWKEKEVLGKPVEFVFHIIHEETEQIVDNPVRIALKEGRTIALANHTLLVTKQGAKIPIADSGAPIKDENERITGAVLVFRDQTDERAKQRQIRESRERFFRAVEHFPGLLIICDLDLNIQFVNETVYQITGRPASWYIGRKEGTIWPREITNKYLPTLTETIRTGKIHYLRTSVAFPRNGERHLDMTFIPLADEKGVVHEIMGIVNDFTKEKQITDELREREVLYHTLTELSPVGIFRTLPDGYTTYVNPKWCQLSGLTPEQALGNEWLAAVHPDDRTELIANWQIAVHDRRKSTAHYRFVKPGGAHTWVLGETVPEVTANGDILGYIGTITDITEQKKAEELLFRSRENFRHSIDESPLGMRILTESGDTLYLNKALLDIHRYGSLEEYLAVPASEKYTAASLQVHLERKKRRKKGEQVESEYEIEIKRKDGSVRNVYVYRKMIYWDGQPQYLVIYQDQTERKKAEEALIRSENSLKESQEIAQIGSWEFDLKTNKTEWSENCYRLFGLEPFEITPSYAYFRSRVLPEDRQLIDDSHNEIMIRKEPVSIKIRIAMPGNQTKWILNKIIPEVINGELVKFRGINMDVTESVNVISDLETAKNKAEESEMLKSAFLANMSHEIRTPLNTILGFSSILTSGEEITTEEKEEYTSIINRSSDNLLQIINDILDLSKLETGQLKIFKSRFDAHPVLEELNKVFIKRLNELGKAEVDLKLATVNGPVMLNLDRVRFYQIFMNLLSNSIKFTDHGSIRFGITQISDNRVSFFVSDTGIGIKKELQNAVFERFRQVNETNTKRHGGTGLGLSIVKNLVELMGGSISLESEIGEGTTIRFNLPADN